MATKDQHLKKAQHNERFLGEFDLTSTQFLDWVITAIFYSALHYIRALAAKNGYTNISSYGEMDHLFSRLSVFRRRSDIFYGYRQLKDDSRAARYDMRAFTPDEVGSLLKDEFDRIKSFVMANL